MGKTGKWLRNLLTWKKDREKEKEKENSGTNLRLSNGTENPTTPISTTPKEKRRWSFRRSSASKEMNGSESSVTALVTVQKTVTDAENDQKKHAIDVVAVSASDAVICSNSGPNEGTRRSVEEDAAIKIQSVFRSYLARKALCALRGLVKLQALVRGHLVRKQATETLRCMQALVIAQARACAQRARMVSDEKANQKQSPYRTTTTEDNLFIHMYNEMDRGLEENIKTVEMDVCESKSNSRGRNSSANHGHYELSGHKFSAYYYSPKDSNSKKENYKVSPAPSALTELSPRACSGHFEDYTFSTAYNSPHSAVSRIEDTKIPFSFTRPEAYEESMSYEYPLFPSYMANTQSSRAKARSHSAPKQRPAESYERQLSRRRASVEGRNVPRPVRMQRSSSHVGATAQNYQYPWSIKLDKSSASLNESECGSTSTVLTNRSLVSYYPYGQRY